MSELEYKTHHRSPPMDTGEALNAPNMLPAPFTEQNSEPLEVNVEIEHLGLLIPSGKECLTAER